MNDHDAPQPLSRAVRQWLEAETPRWLSRRLLSESQLTSILALYEGRAQADRSSGQRFLKIMMGLASLLTGLAALLLIGSNWDEIPRASKLLVIFGSVAATHGYAFYLSARSGRSTGTDTLHFLGCLLFGAGIWLVAQVFHINAHYPDGLLWWGLGTLPFLLALGSTPLHLLYVALLGSWAGAEMFGFPRLSFWWFHNAGLPNGAYSLLLLALPGWLLARQGRSPTALGAYVVLLGSWLSFQGFLWLEDEANIFHLGLVASFMLMMALRRPIGNPLRLPFLSISVTMALIILSILSFHDLTEDLISGSAISEKALWFLPSLVVLLLSLAAAKGAAHNRIPLYIAAIMALALGVRAFESTYTDHTAAGWFLTAAANILMIWTAIWTMNRGLEEDDGKFFSQGAVWFLIWAVMRYADLFGDVGGMAGASLLFLVCAAGIYLLARTWKNRRGLS